MDKKGGTKIRNDKVIESQIQDKISNHIEMDEMWNRGHRLEQVQTGIRQCKHYIRNKQDKCWIWIAICKVTKLIYTQTLTNLLTILTDS